MSTHAFLIKRRDARGLAPRGQSPPARGVATPNSAELHRVPGSRLAKLVVTEPRQAVSDRWAPLVGIIDTSTSRVHHLQRGDVFEGGGWHTCATRSRDELAPHQAPIMPCRRPNPFAQERVQNHSSPCREYVSSAFSFFDFVCLSRWVWISEINLTNFFFVKVSVDFVLWMRLFCGIFGIVIDFG